MQLKYRLLCLLCIMALCASTIYAGNADIIKNLKAISRNLSTYQDKLIVANCISAPKYIQKIKDIELNKNSISEIIEHLQQSSKNCTHNFLFALDIHLSLLREKIAVFPDVQKQGSHIQKCIDQAVERIRLEVIYNMPLRNFFTNIDWFAIFYSGEFKAAYCIRSIINVLSDQQIAIRKVAQKLTNIDEKKELDDEVNSINMQKRNIASMFLFPFYRNKEKTYDKKEAEWFKRFFESIKEDSTHLRRHRNAINNEALRTIITETDFKLRRLAAQGSLQTARDIKKMIENRLQELDQ